MSNRPQTGPPRAPADAPVPVDVDWDAAARWAGRLAPPGPRITRDDAVVLVDSLRDAAARALPLALRSSRLALPVERAGGDPALPDVDVLVVDRPGWSRAAARSFGAMTGPLAPGTGRSSATTAQAAAMLALLSGRVLGQFDPFVGRGRLLLVAPNVVQVERALSADARDFRLWVCVHEQTHALQFAAAPWLAGHLRGEVTALVEGLTRTVGGEELLRGAIGAVRQGADLPEEWSMLDLALDEDQRRRVERVTAVMSLLEGHADVSMDVVGRREIPSAKRLRARMEARRRRARGLDRVLRRLVGMDAKLAQYRRGAQFVRGVRRAGGRDALDPVWSAAEHLPTPRELADPRAWVRRVQG